MPRSLQRSKKRLAPRPKPSARRRVTVVTGTRAEYGLLQSTMQAVRRHPRLTLQLVVSGMHLLRKFGRTIDDIRRDGWPIAATVPMQKGDDSPLDQAQALSRGVAGMARFFERAKTNMVLVLGDRIEAMAGALAAVTSGRFLAHVHGGDLAPGDFDDSFRHAITKLAHVHFPATRAAARRIVRMGEQRRRVHCVGAPGLDRLREILDELKAAKAPSASQGATARRTALVVQHPCGRSAEHERRIMTTILHEVSKADLASTCIYPNSDRGHSGILQAIKSHADLNGAFPPFRVERSIDRDAYLRLLAAADVIIGNSSSGIIEAATAGTPAVNVGHRQTGRECSGNSVIHADETPASIRAAIRKALRKRPIMGAASVYGDGRTGRRIAEILASVPLTDEFRHKLGAY